MSMETQVASSLLVNPTLAIFGAASPVVKSSNNFAGWTNNVIVTKLAGNMPALTGTIPTLNSSVYTFYMDVTGTITVVKGNNVASVASATIGMGDIVPQTSSGLSQVQTALICIGQLIVVNGSASVFTGGTTALDTALIVTYFTNLPISGF